MILLFFFPQGLSIDDPAASGNWS